LPCHKNIKEPIRYPRENRLTLLVPARKTMANVNQINPMRTIRFKISSHDLKNIFMNIIKLMISKSKIKYCSVMLKLPYVRYKIGNWIYKTGFFSFLNN